MKSTESSQHVNAIVLWFREEVTDDGATESEAEAPPQVDALEELTAAIQDSDADTAVCSSLRSCKQGLPGNPLFCQARPTGSMQPLVSPSLRTDNLLLLTGRVC